MPNNYRARLDLQWPIYTAGRLAALQRAAGAERDAAGFDVAAARLDARLEADPRVLGAGHRARRPKASSQRALDTLDAHLRDLRSRLEQGLIPPNEVLTAEAQRSHQQLLAIEARNLRQVAKADLRRVIGEDSGRDVEPARRAHGSDAAGAAAGVARGGARPAARAARASPAASRRRASAKPPPRRRPSRRSRSAGGYDYARPNPRIFPRVDEWHDSWDVSVNVSWSLWDGGRRRAEEAEAAAATRALTARSADFDRQLAFEVEQRRLDVDSALAAIAAADDGVRAAQSRRSASSASASRPAWPRAPTCSTRRPICCRRSWIARARWPRRAWRWRGSTARWAR